MWSFLSVPHLSTCCPKPSGQMGCSFWFSCQTKGTSRLGAKEPSLSRTKHGRQLDEKWTARKLHQMRTSADPVLMEEAERIIHVSVYFPFLCDLEKKTSNGGFFSPCPSLYTEFGKGEAAKGMGQLQRRHPMETNCQRI
jgi:hypothetical protein